MTNKVLPLALMSALAFGGEALSAVAYGMRGGGKGKYGHVGQREKSVMKRRARNMVARAERQRGRRAARA